MKFLNIIFTIIFLAIILSCSQSGRRMPDHQNKSQLSRNSEDGNWSGKTVIKMEKRDGVYQVPIEVNGIKMHFIFDTGAGMVSISSTEALFLFKQGTLDNNDILGEANFVDANGDISEGTIINLKTLKIGNKTLFNIQASVVHNMNAPLLLGQSALEEFGKISIDNQKGEIVFE